MQTINPADVVVPENRIRRAFDEAALAELAQSLKTKGMLHPIVLRNDGVTLVCGERRLRASKLANLPAIPFTMLRDMSEDQVIEAELEENTIRRDISWQERAIALSTLDKLRRSQNPTHTVSDTIAEVMGKTKSESNARELIRLADHLTNPEVANAESAKDAASILRKQFERKLAQAIGESISKVECPHVLLNGDCLSVLSTFPADTFDVICSDPPYGIGADTSFTTETANAHTYADSPAVLDSILSNTLPQITRVCKPDAHAYFFCHVAKFSLWFEALTSLGWSVWPTPLIWYHPNFGTSPNPHFGFRRGYDAIVAARRTPGRPLIRANESDVLVVNQEQNLIHAARKPVELYKTLLSRSARPGDKVLDPFCGSGPIFGAAKTLNLLATGIEMDDKMFNIAKAGLSELYTK